ncbi:hypothetical protein [Romboutsia sp.]|uniref:hypothetical protein n=1 Tax=Romboutsia sp. TaxID=1965302 RepID=UPI003F2DE746
MNDMNNMKKEIKKTAKKAKYMAQEVAEDVKDNFQGAMIMVENKKDEMIDKYEQKKFVNDIKHKMEKDMK